MLRPPPSGGLCPQLQHWALISGSTREWLWVDVARAGGTPAFAAQVVSHHYRMFPEKPHLAWPLDPGHACHVHTRDESRPVHAAGERQPQCLPGVNKADVGYAQDGMLLSPKQDGDPVSCYNMDEPLGHDAQGNRPTSKGRMLSGSTDTRFFLE